MRQKRPFTSEALHLRALRNLQRERTKSTEEKIHRHIAAACGKGRHRQQAAQHDRRQIDGKQELFLGEIVGDEVWNAHDGEDTGGSGELHERNEYQQMEQQQGAAVGEEPAQRADSGTYHVAERFAHGLTGGLRKAGADGSDFK